MNDNVKTEKELKFEEKTPNAKSGMSVLILNIILMLASIAGIIGGGILIDAGKK